MWLEILGKGKTEIQSLSRPPWTYYFQNKPPVLILFNMEKCEYCNVLLRADSALTTDSSTHVKRFGLSEWEGTLPSTVCEIKHSKQIRRKQCIDQLE